MTVHYSWLSDWPPVDKWTTDDVHKTEISEFTAGAEQVEDLWERPKVAVEASYFVEAGDTEKYEGILWLKRALHGRSNPVWVPCPLPEMLTGLRCGEGDGSQVAFIVPISDSDGGTYPAVHVDGVADASPTFEAANLVSSSVAMGSDSADWSESGGTLSLSASYRWQYSERSVLVTATGSNPITLDLVAGERVPVTVGLDYTAIAHLRGDLTPNGQVGISWYNSTPALIQTDWGTAAAVAEDEWTLFSSGAQTAPSGSVTAAVSIRTSANANASETLFAGGCGISLYGAEWWHPSGAPCVVVLSSAPAADAIVTYSGRAAPMREMRLARDNFKHSMSPVGHASLARVRFLEVVQ